MTQPHWLRATPCLMSSAFTLMTRFGVSHPPSTLVRSLGSVIFVRPSVFFEWVTCRIDTDFDTRGCGHFAFVVRDFAVEQLEVVYPPVVAVLDHLPFPPFAVAPHAYPCAVMPLPDEKHLLSYLEPDSRSG